MSGGEAIALRPIRETDGEFLYRVYASTREEELAVVPWNEEQKQAFLRMQFEAQHAFYQKQFPDAQYQVVSSGSETVGRLYVHRRADEIRIIDIALLPEHRGRGLGSALLAEILAEGRRAGKPVRIHVEVNNPALTLYTRLGFVTLEDHGLHQLMEWSPA